MIERLIAPILTAAGRAVASAIAHASDGDMDRAELIVKRFVAATKADLDIDEKAALDALDERFDG